MPGMDGYEVCRHLKGDEGTSDVPIVFMSVLGKTEDEVKGLTAGGADYFTKPFQIDEVIARIETQYKAPESPATRVANPDPSLPWTNPPDRGSVLAPDSVSPARALAGH